MLATLILYFLTAQAPAAETTSAGVMRPMIWTKGSFAPIKARFPASDFNYLDQNRQQHEWHEQGYLLPSERDALFRKLGLETKLQQMDELDKDMLVMGAKAYTVPEMAKQYPMLSTSQLRLLKSEVEKFK